MPEVMRQLPGALKQLHQNTGAKEFHFCDIYAGKKEFKNIDLQVRLGVFKFMAEIFSIYGFPIFVQTLDPITLKDVRQRASFPDKMGPFNLKKQEDLALVFLLIRIKGYLEQTRLALETGRVFVDEGFKKNGVAIHIPFWESVFSDGLICFASSSSIFPIQLADFAAFALNRTQLLIGKPTLNSLDVELMKILTPIAWNFQNIEMKGIELTEVMENNDVADG
ncbi:MAG TPA: hypothetical protein PK344_13520 [Syntrophorhabdaceae bacterium]|mgnify:CR=1 FL=1|nr:hypothetical protein [Syntrophorhabdaceae bacterium]